ncbi:MAG: rod shape-determining protein MreD [Candidatus Nanopelagicales bacterium]
MAWRQAVVIGITTFIAVIVEVTLLSRLGLPGATPDLVVVTVVALALAMGPVQGAAAGFSAGILIDLAPPADTLLGVNALVYIAVGVVTGLAIDPRDRTVPIMIGIVGLATAASTLAVAALDSLMGATRVSWEDMPMMVLTSAFYAVVMAPLVILGIAWAARRVAPDVSVLTG